MRLEVESEWSLEVFLWVLKVVSKCYIVYDDEGRVLECRDWDQQLINIKE